MVSQRPAKASVGDCPQPFDDCRPGACNCDGAERLLTPGEIREDGGQLTKAGEALLLRADIASHVRAQLRSEDVGADNSLAGTLGEAIASEAGSYSLEFVTPEQLAKGIATWLETDV